MSASLKVVFTLRGFCVRANCFDNHLMKSKFRAERQTTQIALLPPPTPHEVDFEFLTSIADKLFPGNFLAGEKLENFRLKFSPSTKINYSRKKLIFRRDIPLRSDEDQNEIKGVDWNFQLISQQRMLERHFRHHQDDGSVSLAFEITSIQTGAFRIPSKGLWRGISPVMLASSS